MNKHSSTLQRSPRVPARKHIDQALRSLDNEFDQLRRILSPSWAWNLSMTHRPDQPVPAVVRSEVGHR
jgi:hypothetical protein